MNPPGTTDIAYRVARRAEPICNLPIGLIISILASAIPLLVRCFQATENIEPTDVRQRALDALDDNPKRFRKRLRRQIKRRAKQNDEDLADEDLDAMTESCIAELRDGDATEFHAFAVACASIVAEPAGGWGEVGEAGDDEGAD